MADAATTFGSNATSAMSSAPRGPFSAMLEGVPDAAILLDEQSRIVCANQHVVHRFGFVTAELIDQPISRLLPNGLEIEGGGTLPEFLVAPQPMKATANATARHSDGTLTPLRVDIGRFDTDHRALALCLLREPVPALDRPPAAAVEARLKEAQRIAQLGSYTWDLATDEHWWSEELYRMLGIPPDTGENLLAKFLELVHTDDRDHIVNLAVRASSGKNIAASFRVLKADGTTRMLKIQAAPTFDDHGRPTHVHGALLDITEQQTTQTALELKDLRYREAQRLAAIGNWEWDLATNTSWWSDELYRILEEDPRDYPATFDNFVAKVHPDDRQVLIDAQSNITAGPEGYRPTESRLQFPGGREKIVEQLVKVRTDAQGKPTAVVGTIHDITERRALENKLRESEARYASTVELAAVGIAHVDVDGNILWSNGRLRDMLGYDEAEMLARSIRDVCHPDDLGKAQLDRHRLHAGEIDTLTIEVRCIRADGTTIWVRGRSASRRAPGGSVLYDVAIIEDVTASKATEERVQYLATHDELTGLPNRTLFGELLQRALEKAKRDERRCAALFIDLDRFKIVNDSLGHEAGDQLLRDVGERLRRCIGHTGVVGRLGGDEFVVLLEDLSDVEVAADVAKRVLAAMHAPISIMAHECRVTVSVGIATYPADARDGATLMKHADMAMYLAKEEGKNNFQFFSSEMSPMSVERLELEVRLGRALQRGEFSLQYQPRVEIASGRITGVEALLRWWNPDLGTVSPAHFIPLAEDTGLIVAIGKWVLRSACEQNVAWQKRGLPGVVVSVNVSPRQFKDPMLLDDIAEILAETGMAPELLELEITESMIMHHVDIAAEKAAAMKELGIKLAIDDFGTGYSSLSQLKRFPIDTLKIDRAFVRDIPESADDTAITKAVVSLGKALGVRVVAEGVETAAQFAFLRANGCDEIQGFYISKPCHPDAFADLLKDPRRGRATG
jgi:diguanylate cyclase (GGDEF)-like protein/PAS domain S-box-containing protein